MSGHSGDPRVVDLSEATTELRARRRLLRDQGRRDFTQKVRRLPVPRLALWVLAFYTAPTAPYGSLVALGSGRSAATSGIFMGVCVAFLASATSSQADVWEFDRQGEVLRSPDKNESHNVYYDINVSSGGAGTPVSKSSRSVNSAIYQPMAEGVAEVYAEDPAIAGAGLSAEEFVRVFVALIDQESRFNPLALSPKGARGLGQLMPETAALLGVEDAAEPMANLHGAARYLTAQLAEFGRVDWALAAYNAGPHRVAQYRGIPPYRETRDYVARITAAAELAAAPTAARSPEVGRARSTALDPKILEPDSLDPTPLDQPVQGTVLEWTR